MKMADFRLRRASLRVSTSGSELWGAGLEGVRVVFSALALCSS